MKLRLSVAFLLVLLCVLAGKLLGNEKQAFAVWKGKNCIQLTEDVRAIAPLKDGQPDYKNVRVIGVVLDNKCYSYEMK